MQKKIITLAKLETFLDSLKRAFAPLSHTHKISELSDYEVDDRLLITSSNPVSNKVVSEKINTLEESVNSLSNSKAEAVHTHNDIYYTEAEIDSKIDVINSNINSKVPNTRTVNGKPLSENISLSASDVNADATGTAESKVASHNTSTTAHNDIRDLISNLTKRLNTLADSDDVTLDQMSELVAYIKSNRSLIESVTTTKVNVSDIVDNLTTNVSNKPLSAAQGVAIKSLIDSLSASLEEKANAVHTHNISDVVSLQSTLDGKSAINHTHDLSTMINTLNTSSTTPSDYDYYVAQYAGGGTTTTTYHRKPMSALWSYIKGKLATVAVSGSYSDLTNKPTIQDNLASNSSTDCLSAKQGKALKTLVEEKTTVSIVRWS